MRVAVAALVSVVSASMACNLVLGIDDVPPVPTHDAGVDAHVVDAGHDHFVVDVGHDAGVDSAVDAADAEAGPVGQIPPPSGPETTSDAGINFAVHYLWLGDSDKTQSFKQDPGAWATFGYNIDGKVTTSASTDVCTLASNASSTVQTDGMNGADNSFGENIVEGISLLFTGVSQDLSKQIASGSFTVLIDTTGLSASPTQTNVGLTAGFFTGSAFPGGMPTFTVADNWPVAPNSLADGVSLANGARISFSDAYVNNGTWVSGDPSDFIFTIQLDGQPFALIIHEAIATFQHTIDDAGASHAENGVIAGVLKASEFIAALRTAAASIDNGSFCGEVDNIATRITAAQDIMIDGTNEPGEPCNGISVALAFTADQIQLPSRIGPAMAVPDGGTPTCPTDAD